jgi:NAD(P)H dehydrogenase (quinone)
MAKEKFLSGLKNAGHEYIVSDLYNMKFNSELSEDEYLREAFYREDIPIADDVFSEQEKIQAADGIVFFYPVFWTEAPAKLIGWFDRVWTSGFAYNPNPKMKILEKALFVAIAGKKLDILEETGELNAMLGDRIRNRAKEKKMVILDSTSHWNEENREKKIEEHLKTVYDLGLKF